jgi:hypothetical protein
MAAIRIVRSSAAILVITVSRAFVVAGILLATTSVAAKTVTLFDSNTRDTSPDGCVARVVDRAGQHAVHGFCGVPLEVPFDEAIAWIERPAEITPFMTDVSEGGEFVLDRFAPAGHVTFPADLAVASGQRLWLVAFATPLRRNVFQHPVRDPRERQAVPAGRVVAVLLDAHDRALLISSLVAVPYRGVAHVDPKRPANGASLIAFISAPERPNHLSDVETLRATDTHGARSPTALVPGSDEMVAVWDALDGPVTIDVDGSGLWLPNAQLTPGPRDIAVLREQLRPLPTLTVELSEIAEDLRPAEMPELTLTVRQRAAEGRAAHRVTTSPGRAEKFERLPLGAYEVIVEIGGFEIRHDADLSSGENARVPVALEPLTLTGTVYRGQRPVEAEIRFLQHDAPAVIKTAPDGTYHATLWRPQRYFVDLVPADDPARPPFREMVSITTGRKLDFFIPEKRLGVRVFDAGSKQPIAGAAISLRSEYTDASGRQAHDVLGFKTTEQAITRLPPQRLGRVELNVHAEGYADMGPVHVPIDVGEGEHIVDIAMLPGRDEEAVEVRLPDGRPAVGAELAIWSGAALLPWRGTAGTDGVVMVPKAAEGRYLLVRHHEAASRVVRYANHASMAAVNLAAPAPPLLVRVLGSDGVPVGPQGVRIAVWQGELRLTGTAAAFLTWSAALTATDGVWVARNLPPQPVRLLATHSDDAARVDAGALDAFATALGYPWPASASIRVTE